MRKLVDELLLERVRHRHFAGLHFLCCGANEAELAVSESAPHGSIGGRLDADRRPEDPACHWPRRIEIAQPRRRIERGAWRVIGEILEPGAIFLRLAKPAGCEIAGKITAEFLDPQSRPALHFIRARAITLAQRIHPGAESIHVKLRDRERSIAALRAPRPAGKHGPGTPRGIGKSRVHNLHEFGIARGKHHEPKHTVPSLPR